MVKIISDSTCDLSEELVKRYDITILPLHILLGDEEYLDGVNITPQEIFDWSDEHKTPPKTSAPSAEQAVELLKPYVEKGQEVICFAIASGMSSSMNVMRLAAEELNAENLVTVIDSANLSTGIGLLVIEAAEMAQQGKSAAEIRRIKASGSGKLCGRHLNLSLSWWQMQWTGCLSRRCIKASSADWC